MRLRGAASSPQWRAYLCAVVLYGVMVLSGCSLLERQINETWPPRSIEADQAEGIAEAKRGLDELAPTPVLYAAIQITDIETALTKTVSTTVPEVKSIKLSSGRQTLFLDFEFDGEFPLSNGDSVGLSGVVSGYAVPAIVGTILILQPGVIQVQISSARYRGVQVPSDAVNLINAALNRFITNINGTVRGQRIDLRTEVIKQFNPADLVSGQNNVTTAYGNPIKVATLVNGLAVLVDTFGIRMLGNMRTLDPDAADRILAQLSATNFDQLNQDDKALLSLCPEISQRSGVPDSLINACKRFREYLKTVASRTTTGGTRNGNDAVNRAYDDLQDVFKAKAASAFGADITPLADRTGVAVAKSFIASSLNAVGKQMEFGLSFAVPDSRLPLDEELRTQRATQLHCGTGLPDCYDRTDCNPTHLCRGRGDCPTSCHWYDVGCRAWKATCEVLRDTERSLCEADKARQRITCELGKGINNAACEVNRTAVLAGCQANQEWLDLWGDKKIGRIEGDIDLKQGTVALTIGGPGQAGLALSPELETISIGSSIRASTQVHADILYTPLDVLGHIFCQARWQGNIEAAATAKTVNFGLNGRLTPRQSDGALVLDVAFDPLAFDLKLEPAPVQALFRQNPHVAIACSGATVIGVSAELLADLVGAIQGKNNQSLLLKDTFRYEMTSLKGILTFPSIAIVLNDRDVLLLRPEWGDKAIVYGVH